MSIISNSRDDSYQLVRYDAVNVILEKFAEAPIDAFAAAIDFAVRQGVRVPAIKAIRSRFGLDLLAAKTAQKQFSEKNVTINGDSVEQHRSMLAQLLIEIIEDERRNMEGRQKMVEIGRLRQTVQELDQANQRLHNDLRNLNDSYKDLAKIAAERWAEIQKLRNELNPIRAVA